MSVHVAENGTHGTRGSFSPSVMSSPCQSVHVCPGRVIISNAIAP